MSPSTTTTTQGDNLQATMVNETSNPSTTPHLVDHDDQDATASAASSTSCNDDTHKRDIEKEHDTDLARLGSSSPVSSSSSHTLGRSEEGCEDAHDDAGVGQQTPQVALTTIEVAGDLHAAWFAELSVSEESSAPAAPRSSAHETIAVAAELHSAWSTEAEGQGHDDESVEGKVEPEMAKGDKEQ